MQPESKSSNITWHDAAITADDRAALHGHQPALLWFTGLSGSGKSTLANAVARALHDRGVHTYVLDGDNVRHGLNRDLTFSAGDRVENIRRIGEVAKLFVDAGLVVMTAFISPYRDDRARAREIVGDRFIEVHVDADLATCEQRDPKGLYKKARAGEIGDFTGISAPYEAPENPELRVDTSAMPLEDCVAEVVAYLEARGALRP
ncbi:MAG: adenylyl-sulfate kinase [Candidatus Hydrogenedentes bacterium]|nr:adenylyl-sulfate kinase [Candidatus Hydrogenedentota bacterium]